ncbi:MAG: phospholipid/cholesterol/gamma-HCH transport system ATP-binding protein [Bradymonadia bacterium]|jgi:phospholipid/cholesterol/gamma-HCH transport system ATP-binding protein
MSNPTTEQTDGEYEHVIDVRGLETRFGSHVVHDNLNLQVRKGEIIGIVGGSGSGKSVLVRQIIMLSTPSKGSVKMFGQETVGIEQRDANLLRRRFGMMFQGGALFSSLTVLENVAVPLIEHTDLPLKLVEEMAMMKIVLAGLPPDAGAKLPKELSGGMLKRAAVARSLALDPDLIFLDEPSAGLDPVSAAALDGLILQLRASLGLTLVMISHDLDSLWRVTDRVAFLGERRILELASMKELSRSKHPDIVNYFGGPRGRTAMEQHL